MERVNKAFAKIEDTIKNSPDSACNQDIKRQLVEKVNEAKATLSTPLDTDKWIYRSVVWFLGAAVLTSLSFTFYLYAQSSTPTDLKMPDIFLAIGSAALGALAGLLAPSPARRSNE